MTKGAKVWLSCLSLLLLLEIMVGFMVGTSSGFSLSSPEIAGREVVPSTSLAPGEVTEPQQELSPAMKGMMDAIVPIFIFIVIVAAVGFIGFKD